MKTNGSWQLGWAALAAAILAACGGGDTPTASSASLAAPSKATALAATAKNETGGRIEPSESGSRAAAGKKSIYIVRMAGDPVATYRGGVQGHSATKPGKGSKIDPTDAAVVGYKSHLEARQNAALAGVGGGKLLYSYGYVFNGFAAELSEVQALKLAQTAGVLSVSSDEIRQADTSSTPEFLGLSGPNGFWASTGATGEDVIIGVIDTGVWPEHPSFSDRTGDNGHGNQHDKLSYHHIRGWHGLCQKGDQFKASDCNQKLIGARYYNAGFGGDAGVAATLPWEFNSPRDYNGHGSHTASTAGGNGGVQATGPTAAFGKISGMAPRARLSVYKALWHQEDGRATGTTGDLVAAIDQAVADGVDVINYSISGSSTNFRDPVEIAFLNAADAGVFVAASAGNSGPTASTVAHPSPWITTVANGTHNRNGEGSVTLGNGATYAGASYSTPVGPADLVDAAASGLGGADPTTLARCYGAADGGARLDPAKVAGKIVVCERGGNVLVNKSQAVKDAGGVGMVLVNTPVSATTTLAIVHVIPTVHLAVSAYAPIKAYVQTPGPTATINQATIVLNTPAPFTATSSSRGPLLASGSLLKPDLMAPGTDILAAVAPPGNNGRLFDLYTGTSMSSPHVAGIAALMKQLHPDWSPMAIKSALMTTGYDVIDTDTTDTATRIFRQGAGFVRPMNAADPGLVFDSAFADWLGFLCGTQLPTSFCTGAGVPVLNPSDLNGASIAIGALAGSQTVTRTVTNVGRWREVYTPSVTGMTGVDVVVSPSTLSVPRGGTATFTIKFTQVSAALNAYAGGQLTLTGNLGHKVRVPMVVKPVALSAPTEVNGSYPVTFGFSGPFTATPRGLLAATTAPGSVATNAVKDFAVTVPAGTTYARFSLFDANVSQASDLDLEVYDAGGNLVGSSGGATAAEEVNLRNPAAGVYTVRVVGFAVPVGSADFTLFHWELGSASAGNMTVSAPANATLGTTATIGLSFSSLSAGTKYLGSVVYGGAAGLPNPTIVRVDAP